MICYKDAPPVYLYPNKFISKEDHRDSLSSKISSASYYPHARNCTLECNCSLTNSSIPRYTSRDKM